MASFDSDSISDPRLLSSSGAWLTDLLVLDSHLVFPRRDDMHREWFLLKVPTDRVLPLRRCRRPVPSLSGRLTGLRLGVCRL